MTGSVIRHAIVFIPLFTFLYIILMRLEMGPLLMLIFIITPILGEVIQLGFPRQWGFNFELTDIIINYSSSYIGVYIGMIGGSLLCKTVTDVVEKLTVPK